MPRKNVEFHPDAAGEFLAAVDWYLERSDLVASRFAQLVVRATELIGHDPHRWPKFTDQTRKYLLQGFPFLIIYRELPSVVQIVAIAHAHRRPGYWTPRR